MTLEALLSNITSFWQCGRTTEVSFSKCKRIASDNGDLILTVCTWKYAIFPEITRTMFARFWLLCWLRRWWVQQLAPFEQSRKMWFCYRSRNYFMCICVKDQSKLIWHIAKSWNDSILFSQMISKTPQMHHQQRKQKRRQKERKTRKMKRRKKKSRKQKFLKPGRRVNMHKLVFMAVLCIRIKIWTGIEHSALFQYFNRFFLLPHFSLASEDIFRALTA